MLVTVVLSERDHHLLVRIVALLGQFVDRKREVLQRTEKPFGQFNSLSSSPASRQLNTTVMVILLT